MTNSQLWGGELGQSSHSNMVSYGRLPPNSQDADHILGSILVIIDKLLSSDHSNNDELKHQLTQEFAKTSDMMTRLNDRVRLLEHQTIT